MRKLLIATICCCCVQLAIGQMIRRGGNFLQTVSGEPITQNQSVNKLTDGTPYLKNDWAKATIITTDGESHKDEDVKLNLLEGKLHYKSANGVEMVAITPIKEVILADESGKPMKFVHSTSFKYNDLGSVWLQELNEGSVRVYKLIRKDVKENKGYGSAVTEMSVTDEKRYYLFLNNALLKVKNLRDITDLLSGKWYNQLEAFIRQNSLKGKAEGDMARLVDYYNSISKK